MHGLNRRGFLRAAGAATTGTLLGARLHALATFGKMPGGPGAEYTRAHHRHIVRCRAAHPGLLIGVTHRSRVRRHANSLVALRSAAAQLPLSRS